MDQNDNEFCWDNDYRKDSIYQNSEIVFDKAAGEPKGTILLIHGTAPQNIDGQIAIKDIYEKIIAQDPELYIVQPTYKNLAIKLNSLGWNTVRYTRVGVYQSNVNVEEYGKTDLNNLVTQLTHIWNMIPSDKPKIAFAWSGGSVHILQLPLQDAAAIIILGGLSTKRTEAVELRAKNKEELQEIKNYFNSAFSKRGQVARDEMFHNDMPYGRLFDEHDLEDNWTYLKKYNELPTLILHGDSDPEVNDSQAKLWKDKLTNHKITTIIKKMGIMPLDPVKTDQIWMILEILSIIGYLKLLTNNLDIYFLSGGHFFTTLFLFIHKFNTF